MSPEPKESPLSRFKPVERPAKPVKPSNRQPAGATVRPTGTSTLNTEGSEVVKTTATENGLDADTFCFKYHVDEEARQIAGTTVDSKVKGASPVRRNSDGTLTIYLDGVFEEYPRLRPTSRHQCQISAEPDGNGGRFILISLNVALPKTSGRKRKPAEKAPDKTASAVQAE